MVYTGLFTLAFILAAAMGGLESDSGDAGFGLVLIVIFFFYLGNFIPNIAIAVRRFHDQNQSGWMYLLAFIPYLGRPIILIFMCIDGTHGENRFGEDPLGESLFDTFS